MVTFKNFQALIKKADKSNGTPTFKDTPKNRDKIIDFIKAANAETFDIWNGRCAKARIDGHIVEIRWSKGFQSENPKLQRDPEFSFHSWFITDNQVEGVFELVKELKSHDWTFEYSDDHGVWRSGSKHKSVIQKMIKDLLPKLSDTDKVDIIRDGEVTKGKDCNSWVYDALKLPCEV